MQSHATPADAGARRHRPKTLTVFAAAFTAGAVLAYGVDRVVDVHVVRVGPQVESEPIFVALRSLPQGAPVTIWDVALKDWPKAMLPTTALRADATFDGLVLRHPIREGQPLLSVQLVRDAGLSPATGVAVLPPEPAPPTEPAPEERFTPATPADPPAAAAAAVERPLEPMPALTDAPATVPPAAPEAGLVAVEATPDVAPRIDDSAALVAVEGTPPTTTDIDPPPVDLGEAVAVDVTSTVPQSADSGDSVDTVDDRPFDGWRGADVEPTPADEPATVTDAEPTSDPPIPMVAVSEVDQPTPAPAVVPLPLVAPVPALPSTDLERSLAGLRRETRDGIVEEQTADASVLDRTTEALPPPAAPRMPTQHLVIPERIALAADASFTQQPPAAMAEPVAGQATPEVRTPTTAAAAPGRAPSATYGSGRAPAGAQPTPRKPAKSPRQPAGKTQAAAPRFWSAWLPQFSGGRQR